MEKLTVSIDICLIPMGVGTSVSKYIVECQKIFKKYHLKTYLHAYGTNIEGDWDTVFNAIKECHIVCHEKGAPRINTTIKCGTRIDKKQSLQDKIDSVKEKLDAEN
tara:strand:- start:38 stop:355 length:318 start_codon:yes stop_codon:yes gene_type:complete